MVAFRSAKAAQLKPRNFRGAKGDKQTNPNFKLEI